jgi:hypothetical protein
MPLPGDDSKKAEYQNKSAWRDDAEEGHPRHKEHRSQVWGKNEFAYWENSVAKVRWTEGRV